MKQSVITYAVIEGVRGQREMKECKIEWIAQIPSDWDECRIKDVVYPKDKEIFETDEIVTCFRDGEVTLRRKRREDGFTVSFTEHGYHGVDIGDLSHFTAWMLLLGQSGALIAVENHTSCSCM